MIIMVNTDPKKAKERALPKGVCDFIRDAHKARYRFRVCTPALELLGNDLMRTIADTARATDVVRKAMDERAVATLTY